MKKLIIALLLCLISFESHAGARADRYRLDYDDSLLDEITDHVVNTAARSMYALDKPLDWLHLHRRTEKLCYMSCISGKHDGKFYNKNFCENLCEYSSVYFRAKVENTLLENDSPLINNMFRHKLRNNMWDFFKEDKDNIVITESYYVEPEYPTIFENVYQLAYELLGLFS